MRGGTVDATLVLKNAKVLTVDDDFSVAQAVAVRGDTIVAVGSDADVAALVGTGTRVLDLGGRTLLPGINDSHGHPAFFGSTRPPLSVDLYPPRVGTVAEAVAEVAAFAARVPAGQWVRGFGWDATRLVGITKYDLDAVTPDHPALLSDFSGHNLWVNSLALQVAGVTADTPDPEGGIVERDPATREPLGVFRELSAQGLVMRVVPLFTREEKRTAVLAAMEVLNGNGVTSYTESALGPGGDAFSGGVMGQEVAEIYKDLCREGAMTARVTILTLLGEYGAISLPDFARGLEQYEWATDVDPRWVRFPGVKIFADGVPITKTSALWEEYVDGGLGSLAIPGATEDERTAALVEMITMAAAKAVQVGVHATGDRAVGAALDGFERAAAADSASIALRHYVVHAELVAPGDSDRAARLGVGFNMQPTIMSMIADTIAGQLGPDRAMRDWPFATTVRSGAKLMASSDLPVTYPDWRTGLQAMVLREGIPSGRVSGPDERVGLADAVRAYTINGAWQDHMDDVKGSIEVGKLADFCVLDGDLLGVDLHSIKDLAVALTVVGGAVVYDAGLLK
jgi:predicted amidohydrolase YtcJ